MNPLLLATAVQKQVQERLGERWRAKCFSYLGNTVLLAQLSNENEVSDLTDDCDRFCGYVGRMIGAVVTVGIGQVCSRVLDLASSYTSAREAVSYRVIYGTGKAINMKEIAPQEMKKSDDTDDAELSNLFKAIRLNDREEIEEAVESYWSHLALQEKSLQQYHIEVMNLVSALYRFASNNEISVDEFSSDMRKLYGELLDLGPQSLKKWIMNISFAFHERLLRARSRSTQSIVSKAREYVRNNYSDEDLSLDSICEFLGVSNSYFSTIFKKETGSTFIGYLTDYRMERASRLLIETNEKSYIIAKHVGYSDPNYFSYVFKRKFGVSPSKYRTEYGTSEA